MSVFQSSITGVIVLLVVLSMSLFGGTGSVAAQSATAGDIRVTNVTVDDANGAIPENRNVTAVATLRNFGTAAGSQNVTLVFNNTTALTTRNVTLDAGNTTEVRLTGTLPLVPPRTYNLTVATDGNASTTTIEVIRIGDANADGAVGSSDATLVLRRVVGLSVPVSFDPEAADCFNTGTITSGDATMILRQTVGLPFPGRKAKCS